MLLKKSKNSTGITVSNIKRDVARSSFSRAKVKLFSFVPKIKNFYREYRLPSIATLSFLLIIVSLFVVRQFERTSLLALINEVTDGGRGYSTLISSDDADQFTRNDTTEEQNRSDDNNSTTSNSTQSTSTPFTINSTNPTTQSNSGSSSGGSSGGSSGSSGGTTTTPTIDPFIADIESFSQTSTTLQCSNPSKPNKGSCSKVYSFSSNIKTVNGPGSVNYSWQSDIDSSTGNFSVGSGSAITAVSKEITLPCNKNASFRIQLAITSPSFLNSNTINVGHNCNEI